MKKRRAKVPRKLKKKWRKKIVCNLNKQFLENNVTPKYKLWWNRDMGWTVISHQKGTVKNENDV